MRKTFILFAGIILAVKSYAQEIKTDSSKCQSHYLTSLHLGSSGLGLDFKYNFKSHSSVRIGFSTIPLNYSTVVDLGLEMKTDAKANYTNVHLLYEFQPFKNVKRLKVVGGVAYFTQGYVSTMLTPQSDVVAGITTLTPDEIGDLSIKIDSKGIAPYLGLGVFKTLPKKRLNVNFDLGAFFLPKPVVTAVGTKALVNTTEMVETLNENLKDYRWMPVLQMNINYLIK